MVGIKAFGAYIPIYRLDRQLIIQAWMQKDLAATMKGERSVANYDEDPLTMATEAALNCLEGVDPKTVDGLYFASTTAPYLQKSTSSFISVVADLGDEVSTADFANSLRAGTMAMKSAFDAVKAGNARSVLITTADLAVCEPGFYMEHMLGDGAAALLIGKDDVVCEIEDLFSINQEFIDVWRKKDDIYLHYDDEKFATTYGYFKLSLRALRGLMKKAGISADEITRIVAYAPQGPAYMGLAKQSGMGELFNQDPLLSTVGSTGVASALLQLVKVLEESKPEDRIILLSYGDGCDAFLLRVTENIGKLPPKRRVSDWVKSKTNLTTYAKFIKFKDLIKTKTGMWQTQPFSSIAYLWREQKQNLALYGKRCNKCNTTYYPARRVCYNCQSKDDFTDVKISRKGKVVTHSIEGAISAPDTPVGMVVVDLEGGGRLLTQFTDGDTEKLSIDMPIELTLRKYHEAKEFNNYFWKARPAR